jgi:hypothetical protein
MIMKKLFSVIMLALMAISYSGVSAQVVTTTTTTRHTFHYYPGSNIYFDVTDKNYLFNDHGTWVTSKTLPSGIVLNKSARRVTVYHPDKDVWVSNNKHKVKYKNANANRGKSYKRSGKGKKH